MGATFVPLDASGVVAPVVLVEVLTASGAFYSWSEEQFAIWPSVIQSAPCQFYNFLTGAQFHVFGTTQTDTATVTVQNISGNTVERDTAFAFSRVEFIGALVVCRIWRGDAESALFTFTGNVANVDLDEKAMTLSIEGFGNWSAISAPAFDIDVACPLFFGSVACGSTSSTPCDHTLGTCSSIERFAGVIIEWDNVAPNQQIAQPPPAVFYNPARAF